MKRTGMLIGGILLGIAIGVLILLGFRELAPAAVTGDPGSSLAPEIGAPAPGFSLETLDGSLVDLADLRGRVVLLNFWATWCAPCRLEMPEFQAKAAQYPQDLVVVAVNYDEEPEVVQAFVDELGLDFNILLDPGGVVNRQYRVRGYPTSFLIDPEGQLQVQHIGLLTSSQIDDYLAQLGLE